MTITSSIASLGTAAFLATQARAHTAAESTGINVRPAALPTSEKPIPETPVSPSPKAILPREENLIQTTPQHEKQEPPTITKKLHQSPEPPQRRSHKTTTRSKPPSEPRRLTPQITTRNTLKARHR